MLIPPAMITVLDVREDGLHGFAFDTVSQVIVVFLWVTSLVALQTCWTYAPFARSGVR